MCEVSVWPLYEKNKRKRDFPYFISNSFNKLINILVVDMNPKNIRFKTSKKRFSYLLDFMHYLRKL